MLLFFKMIFIMLTITGTLITISAQSWMSMWMGLEINLLSIIPLLTSSMNTKSTEASIKYFITQVMASNIFLIVIIMYLNNVEQTAWQKSFNLILESALLTKMGAAPFHLWLPEVMKGLTWMNCLIMLTWQKIAPMVILINLVKPNLFTNLAIVSSVAIGSILGFNQTNLKKIMAYSSINHMGWMMSTMYSSASLWLLYFVIYSVISVNIILILEKMNLDQISKMSTFTPWNKMNNLFFSMNFFSLGGIPPFLGFLPKWLTIKMLMESYQAMLAAVMIIFTLIALFFYLRLTFSSITIESSINSKFINQGAKMNCSVWMINFWSITALILTPAILNI
nr:NADH dehydrogenase subunit 2 [Chlamisus sp. N29]